MENLPKIADNVLWSDAERIRQKLDCTIVGMSEIKRRRLCELEVECHPSTMVGEYVPFYFCPRSVMLYLLHKGNHVDLKYTGGQRPIVHLEADLRHAVDWADSAGRSWAISKGNAGTPYRQFVKDMSELDTLDWAAIAARIWNDPIVRERKQAEFLVYGSFPWRLIERIGVIDKQIQESVAKVLPDATHMPDVVVAPNWYY